MFSQRSISLRHMEDWVPVGIVSNGGYVSTDLSSYASDWLDHVSLSREHYLVEPPSKVAGSGLASLFKILDDVLGGDLLGIINTMEGVILVPHSSFFGDKFTETFEEKPFYKLNSVSGVMGGRQRFSIPSSDFKDIPSVTKFFAFGKIVEELGIVMEAVESSSFPGHLLFFAQAPDGGIEIRLYPNPHYGGDMQCFSRESAGKIIKDYKMTMDQTLGNPLVMGKAIKKMKEGSNYTQVVTTEMLRLMVARDAKLIPGDCCGLLVTFINGTSQAIFVPKEFEKSPMISGNKFETHFNHNERKWWFKRGNKELNAYLIFRTLRKDGLASIGPPIRGCFAVKKPKSDTLVVYVIFADVYECRPGYISGDEAGEEAVPYMKAKIEGLSKRLGFVPKDHQTPGNYFFNPETKDVEFIDFEHWNMGNLQFRA